jgi:hypothetical protein
LTHISFVVCSIYSHVTDFVDYINRCGQYFAVAPHMFNGLAPCVRHLAEGELTLALTVAKEGGALANNAGVMTALMEHTAGVYVPSL